jgi:hypothetical protein
MVDYKFVMPPKQDLHLLFAFLCTVLLIKSVGIKWLSRFGLMGLIRGGIAVFVLFNLVSDVGYERDRKN